MNPRHACFPRPWPSITTTVAEVSETMSRQILHVLVAALLAIAAGCATPPADGPKEPVRALRYRVMVVESALDYSHGGGQWIDELYLPDAGVVCNVVWNLETCANEKGEHVFTGGWVPTMNAFFGSMEERIGSGSDKSVDPRKPPVEITVPSELAERIMHVAEVEREQRRKRGELARILVDRGLLGGHESVTPRYRWGPIPATHQ
jgi:hypothetical protein